MSTPVLHVEHITMQFGGVVAVNDLSMDIYPGEIVALIGPNGAGKTTAFNCITGVYEPTNGRVDFMGEPIVCNHPRGKMKKSYAGAESERYLSLPTVSYTPDKITKRGIARTFQNIRLFKSMTVFENVLTAMHVRRTSNVFSATFRANHKEEAAQREKALELLKIVGLDDVKDELATALPYGKQRRLEIARALATSPKLLLLDEPAAGMNPQETLELTAFIRSIRDQFGLTIFLIEHHMNLVMDISDRIYVIRASLTRIWGWTRMRNILEIKNLVVSYGGIEAVKGIDLKVEEGKIVTLIGSNGAGKSTTLKAVAGLVRPKSGEILLNDANLVGKSTDQIVSSGVTLVPEGRRVFENLTVAENLRIGAYLRKDPLADDLARVYDLFPRLKERAWQQAGTLSGGEQQMLAVGRALMAKPKLIMMDEPSLGLAPIVVRGIFEIIREINRQGITVLLIEQNANMALKIADWAYVMQTGSILMQGPGEELAANEEVKAAYLGTAK